MIYVSQGHERGIGLEVFLKSYLLLSPSQQKNIELCCYPDSLEMTLKSLGYSYQLSHSELVLAGQTLSISTPAINEGSQSLNCMLHIFACIESEDVLLTLPTSKDQLAYQEENFLGHTEFFRHYFNRPNLPMCFLTEGLQTLLLTDHIPISDISHSIKAELIVEKVSLTLEGLKKENIAIDSIYFAGINPHAGENGLLGSEEQEIKKGMDKLIKKYPHQNFMGPFSADMLHQNVSSFENSLLVYSYHDQLLPLFKYNHGLIGSNTTFGLPFRRISVDHGTAFGLFGKNKANYHGCFYLLKQSLAKMAFGNSP